MSMNWYLIDELPQLSTKIFIFFLKILFFEQFGAKLPYCQLIWHAAFRIGLAERGVHGCLQRKAAPVFLAVQR